MANQNNEYKIDHPNGFTEFCQAIGPEAFRLASYWTRNKSEAEDIVQEAFLRTWKSRKDVRTNVRGWFFRVLWHVFLDKRRSSKGESLYGQEWEKGVVPSSYKQIDDRVEIDWLLQTLSEEDRQLLAMHYSADLTYRQIAEITGMREGTIKSRVHRAIKTIRKQLPKEYRNHFFKEGTNHE